MRIGIDARSILNPEKSSEIGVGHYTYQLIRNLLQIDDRNEYIIFFDFKVRKKDIQKFRKKNVKIKFYPFSDYKKYMPVAYNEIFLAAALAKEDLDVLHVTSQFNRIPMTYRGKIITTIHDLSAFKVPQTMAKIKRMKNKTVTRLMIDKSCQMIVPSNLMKNDLEKFFGINEKKISVIESGLDKRFWEKSKIKKDDFLKKQSIEGEYILFLGTLDPSKNITRLLQAFRIFLEKTGKKYTLVLAGKRGWLSKEYRQIAKDLGIDKKVKFIGYVVGDDLVPLYEYAKFFVLPSLYEGFGMTVLESYAVGTPVIASDSNSVSEIVKDGAFLVNPMSVEEISEAMVELEKNEELRKELSQKGKEKTKKFDWKKCARRTLEVYKKINI